jgi:hypothetical protein
MEIADDIVTLEYVQIPFEVAGTGFGADAKSTQLTKIEQRWYSFVCQEFVQLFSH